MYFGLLAKIAPTAELDSTQTIGVIISGLVVVFLVLVILVLFVGLFGSFFDRKKKNVPPASAPKPEVKKEMVQSAAPAVTAVSEECDDDEVIAVISAVIAQMSAEDGKQYKLKSVRAKNTKSYGRPVWAAEGLRQNTTPF